MPERDDRVKLGFKEIAGYLVLWIVSTALILVDMALARNACMELLAWYAKVRNIADTAARFSFGFVVDAVDRGLLLMMAVVGLGAAIGLEALYRHLAEHRRLLRDGWKVPAILVGLALISLLIRFAL